MAAEIFHLDTCTVVGFLRAKSEKIRERLNSVHPNQIAISKVVRAELIVGCLRSQRPAFHRERVDEFLQRITVVDFDDQAAEHYAKIRFHIETLGKPIGPNDLFIAATARASNATLVTINESEFRRVPELNVENWA